MGAAHPGTISDDALPTATDALLDLLVSEDEESPEAMDLLRRASCHVVLPDREPSALRQMLARRGQRYTHSEVEESVFEVSLGLLPESWAAARERLRVRVEAAEKTVALPKPEEPSRRKGKSPVLSRRGSRPAAEPTTSPTPEGAILKLLSDDTACLREVASLSQYPLVGEELRRVSQQVWHALRRRGRDYRGRHFSDHLAAVVKDLFPHSKGAEWSPEWAHAIAHVGVEHVARRTPPGAQPVPSEEEERAFKDIRQAAISEDRRAYRLAVRSWVDAVLLPFEGDAADAG